MWRRPILVAALAVLTAGCNIDLSDRNEMLEPLPTDVPVVTTVPAEVAATVTPTAPPATEAAPTTVEPTTTTPPTTELPTTTTEPAPTAAECLAGTWRISQEQVRTYYDGLAERSEGELRIRARGTARLEVAADGRFTYTPDIDLEIVALGAPGTGSLKGRSTGSLQVSGGAVRVRSVDTVVDAAFTIGGTPFDGAEIAGGVLIALPFADAPVDCTAARPVVGPFTLSAG
jgi:hypothetical protein